MSNKNYRQDINSLKGFAILAVVLFHMGLLKTGYLGVDAFFVINGFLVIPSVVRKMANGNFSYIPFVLKRWIRLYPMIVLATTVCLAIGFFGMLPDNYENVGQAVVASNLMSENILSAITTHDYWNVVNDYNPLMHLWYVGVLFEFYILFSLILWYAKKIARVSSEKGLCNVLYVLTAVSFLLYIIPIAGANKFYFIQYRFFELGLGGILALKAQKMTFKQSLKNVPVAGFIGSLIFFAISLVTQDYSSLGCQPIVVTNSANTAVVSNILPPPHFAVRNCALRNVIPVGEY